MAIFPSQTIARILKALGPHGPDGVLAFAIFAGVLVAAPTLDLLPCAVFGIAMFALYAVRQVLPPSPARTARGTHGADRDSS